jgi:hypothetical protein
MRTGTRKMKMHVIGAVVAAVFLTSPAAAQGWFLYTSEEDNFTINFPDDPSIETTTYTSPSGHQLPARVYTAMDATGTYIVTAVDYENASAEEIASSIEDAADSFRMRDGETTLDEFGYFEGADSQIMQTSNPDGTRSYITIAYLLPTSGLHKLYIVEGIVPARGVTAGVFQQSLGWVDSFGTRIRYQRDVDGNRYRVVPDAGSTPLVSRASRD